MRISANRNNIKVYMSDFIRRIMIRVFECITVLPKNTLV